MLQRFVGLNTKARPPICCAVARSAADKRAHVRIYCFIVGTAAAAICCYLLLLACLPSPPQTQPGTLLLLMMTGAERWACPAGRFRNPVVVRAGEGREHDKEIDWTRMG